MDAKVIPTDLDSLSHDLLQLKAHQAALNNLINEKEAAIIAIVGANEEGAKSEKTQFYKVTTTGKLNRKLDVNGLNEVRHLIPDEFYARLIRVKPEVNLTELRYVQNNEPEIYSVIAGVMTTKPAKTAVAVEKLEAA